LKRPTIIVTSLEPKNAPNPRLTLRSSPSVMAHHCCAGWRGWMRTELPEHVALTCGGTGDRLDRPSATYAYAPNHRSCGKLWLSRRVPQNACQAPFRAGEAPASKTQSFFQDKRSQFLGLVAPTPSAHQARLHRRRANTSPHDSPRARTLSGSVPRSKMMQSRIQQRRTIEPAFHRREPKTSGVDRRLSWVDWRRVRVCHAPRH